MVFLMALFITFSKRRDDLINEYNQVRESLLDYNLQFVNTVISVLEISLDFGKIFSEVS